MKRLLLAFALVCLFSGIAFCQEGMIQLPPVLTNSLGQPLAGVNVAVCGQTATTAAAVANNIATYTVASTTGYLAGMTLYASGFTGADTYFNTNSAIVSVTATTVSIALTHAAASASTNGTLYAKGNSTTACAPISTLYTDSTGNTTTPNPFTSDGLGNVPGFVAPGYYEIQTYGPTVSTTINLTGIGCVPASSNCGAINGSLFGAVVVDGVTNPTVQAGLTSALTAPGHALYIPGGTYSIGASLNVAGGYGLDIGGAGIGKTILQQTALANLNYLMGSAGTATLTNVTIHDLTIDVNGSAQSGGFGRCFDFESSGLQTNLKLLRVECKNTTGTGGANGHGFFGSGVGTLVKLEIASSIFTNIANRGIWLDSNVSVSYADIHDNYIESKNSAVAIDAGTHFSVANNRMKQLAPYNFLGIGGGSTNGSVIGNTILGLGVNSGTTSDLITIDATAGPTQYIEVIGNQLYNSGDNCISIQVANNNLIEGNLCHDSSTHGIAIIGGSNNTIRGNLIFNPAQLVGLGNLEKVGIKLLSYPAAAANNNTISDNYIADTLMAHVMLYGVELDNTNNAGIAGTVVEGNDVYNAQTADFSNVSTNIAGITNLRITNASLGGGAWTEQNLINAPYTHRFNSGFSTAQIIDLILNDGHGGGAGDVWSIRKDAANNFCLLDVANVRCLISGTAGATSFAGLQNGFGLNNLLESPTAPTINPASGFNTGAITRNNGTASIILTVGSGAANSTGTIGLPTALNAWNCHADNQTRADLILQSGASANNAATFTNFGTTFAATNWTNGDVLNIWCTAN